MNRTIRDVLLFGAGFAAGAYVMHTVFRTKYQEYADAQIDDVRDHYRKKEADLDAMIEEKAQQKSMEQLTGKYRTESDPEDIAPHDPIEIIQPDEFGDIDDYETRGLTYYADGKAFIKQAIRARKDYRGSGTPTMFTTEDALTEMLLLEDGMGRPLYTDEAALARKLRVAKIVTIPEMEGRKGAKGGDLAAVIVNLADYTVGADKGGAVSMFDDFDIDFNAQKYLIETRCSGALTSPYSAMAIEWAA